MGLTLTVVGVLPEDYNLDPRQGCLPESLKKLIALRENAFTRTFFLFEKRA